MKPGDADALLFDLGGVVIDIDFNRVTTRWAQHAGCDERLVRERFSHDEAYCRHEVGEIDIAAYFASLRASLGINLADAQFLDGWNALYIGEIPCVAGLLARARERIPLYAFTNTNRAHEECWEVLFARLVTLFRKIFVSSTMKLRKPEREAFDFVVKEIGVPAGRIVFFDDNADNVAGAHASGLQAVHVRSPADVERTLAELGLV